MADTTYNLKLKLNTRALAPENWLVTLRGLSGVLIAWPAETPCATIIASETGYTNLLASSIAQYLTITEL